MILDSGPVRIGLESTIVDFTEDVPVLLRPGYINIEMLRKILGEVRVDPGIRNGAAEKGVRPKAPGMRYRHYAPKASLTIVEGPRESVTGKINELAAKAMDEGKKVGIIAADDTASCYHASIVKDIGDRNTDKEIAQHLFSVLREFDAENVDMIYSESFNTPRMGQAIMNRLLKAAGHKVLSVP